jgi:hypothetical protein
MFYKALIRSVMTYACPTWEHAADAYLLKLQHLQNKVFCATGNLHRCISVHELYVDFKISYVYDYTTKLRRTQAEVILNHVNTNVRVIGQREARHRKYKRLKFGGGQTYDCSTDELRIQSSYIRLGITCCTSLH